MKLKVNKENFKKNLLIGALALTGVSLVGSMYHKNRKLEEEIVSYQSYISYSNYMKDYNYDKGYIDGVHEGIDNYKYQEALKKSQEEKQIYVGLKVKSTPSYNKDMNMFVYDNIGIADTVNYYPLSELSILNIDGENAIVRGYQGESEIEALKYDNLLETGDMVFYQDTLVDEATTFYDFIINNRDSFGDIEMDAYTSGKVRDTIDVFNNSNFNPTFSILDTEPIVPCNLNVK